MKYHPGPDPRHPLIKGSLFFTIPPELLKRFVKVVGEHRLPADVLALDRTCSELAGLDCDCVAVIDGVPVINRFLHEPRPLAISASDAAIFGEGWSPARIQSNLTGAAEVFDHNVRALRANAGWLLTNPLFWSEHDTFVRQWWPQIQQCGMPVSLPLHSGAATTAGGAGGEATPAFAEAHARFLRRWALAQLSLPWLPQPMGASVRLGGVSMLPGHASDDVIAIEYPRNVPLPSSLRSHVETALCRSSIGDHLAEWTALVSRGSRAKRALDRYARLFPFTHLWRVVHSRYRRPCRRKQAALLEVFADFLCVDAETARQDLRFVRNRLGAGWAVRPFVPTGG